MSMMIKAYLLVWSEIVGKLKYKFVLEDSKCSIIYNFCYSCNTKLRELNRCGLSTQNALNERRRDKKLIRKSTKPLTVGEGFESGYDCRRRKISHKQKKTLLTNKKVTPQDCTSVVAQEQLKFEERFLEFLKSNPQVFPKLASKLSDLLIKFQNKSKFSRSSLFAPKTQMGQMPTLNLEFK